MRSLKHSWVVVLAVAAGCGREAPFKVRESVEQLHVTHATPGEPLVVVDAQGHQVASGAADSQGSLVFRGLPPGTGYTVRTTGKPPEQSRPLKVMSVEGSKPPAAWYSQRDSSRASTTSPCATAPRCPPG